MFENPIDVRAEERSAAFGAFAALFLVMAGDPPAETQAKGIYSCVGAGSVLGAVAGAGVARILTLTLDPRHLLIASAAFFLASGLGALLFLRPKAPGKRAHGRPARVRRRLYTLRE